jgi:putative redox protein
MSAETPDHVAITKVRCRSLGGLAAELTVKDHAPVVADEPLDFAIGSLAGTDTGWTPVQYQLAALISCANVAIAITAEDQGFQLDGLEIRAQSDLDLRGLLDGDPERSPEFLHVGIEYRIETSEPAGRIEALAREADRRCPQVQLFHRARVPLTQVWTRDGAEVCAIRTDGA